MVDEFPIGTKVRIRREGSLVHGKVCVVVGRLTEHLLDDDDPSSEHYLGQQVKWEDSGMMLAFELHEMERV